MNRLVIHQFNLKSRQVVSFVALLALFVFVAAKAPILTAREVNEPPPKIIRTCCAFGTDLRIVGIPFYRKSDIISVKQLGQHRYLGDKAEGNGIIYTENGGFIDLGHMRDFADWTAFLYNHITTNCKTGEEIAIDLGTEGGEKTLLINIPETFTDSMAIELSGKIAYDISLWHEIATWFGASYIPLIPERYSSFSPEDLYSNLLGIQLGMEAIKSHLPYDEAMTELIISKFRILGTVSSIEETARYMYKVEDLWWSSEKAIPSKGVLNRRYLDNDSFLLPWLVHEENSGMIPFKLNKPDSEYSKFYQFRVKLNYKFPVKEIFETPTNREITQHDFKILLDYIKQELNQES